MISQLSGTRLRAHQRYRAYISEGEFESELDHAII